VVVYGLVGGLAGLVGRSAWSDGSMGLWVWRLGR